MAMDDGSHSPAIHSYWVSVRGKKPMMAKRLLRVKCSFSGNEEEKRKLEISCSTSGFLDPITVILV